MKEHWKANAAKSFLGVALTWFVALMISVVITIYLDHTSERAKVTALNDEIDGPNGYKIQIGKDSTQISDLQSRLAVAQSDADKAQTDARMAQKQFETLKAARQPGQPPIQARDPDGLYQFGNLVGQFSGERIDDANGFITFDLLKTYGHFNTAQNAEFRSFLILCDTVVGGPRPGMNVGTFTAMNVGGKCRIVGPKVTP